MTNIQKYRTSMYPKLKKCQFLEQKRPKQTVATDVKALINCIKPMVKVMNRKRNKFK